MRKKAFPIAAGGLFFMYLIFLEIFLDKSKNKKYLC